MSNPINVLLRNYIKTELQTAVGTEYIVQVASDVDNVLVDSSNISVVISSGNGTRMKTESFSYISDSLAMWCYIPINYKNDFMSILEDFADTLSDTLTTRFLGSKYYVTFNLNAPSTDGLIRRIGGQDCIMCMLAGNVDYAKKDFNQYKGLTVEIQSDEDMEMVELENIVSFSSNGTASIESIPIPGSPFADQFNNQHTVAVNISVVYDANNVLHRVLKQIAIKASSLEFGSTIIPALLQVKLSNDDVGGVYFNETCYVSVNESMQDGFTTLDISITR